MYFKRKDLLIETLLNFVWDKEDEIGLSGNISVEKTSFYKFNKFISLNIANVILFPPYISWTFT